MKIEAERAPLMDKMLRLIKSYERLKKLPASPKNTLAMKRTGSAIGKLEDKNKELAEKSNVLWRAVLTLDGLELSSPEILKEQSEVWQGIKWLERITKRLALDLLAWDSREESLMTISNLHSELYRRSSELAASQERHRWARAEAITKRD
jgi:hypothetical protein